MIAVGIVHWLRYIILKDGVKFIYSEKATQIWEKSPNYFYVNNIFQIKLNGIRKTIILVFFKQRNSPSYPHHWASLNWKKVLY